MRTRGLILSVVVTTFLTGTPALAALRVHRIYFDPPGRDTRSHSDLYDEFIVIRNTGRTPRELRGWRIHDRRRRNVYRFETLKLGPGNEVRIHAGTGPDTVASDGDYDLYWGVDHYVWGNDGDRATLRTPEGRTADRCRYGPGASSPAPC